MADKVKCPFCGREIKILAQEEWNASFGVVHKARTIHVPQSEEDGTCIDLSTEGHFMSEEAAKITLSMILNRRAAV